MPVVQVDGYYVSSSLPKAFYMPARSTHNKSPRITPFNSDTPYLIPERKSAQSQRGVSSENENILPVAGRHHLSVQTDLYLEELCDVIEVADAECETDPLLDRPPSPLFVPAKTGTDIATQIYPGDLFDFDEEVEPLLEALVGQTLEQALIEVMAEDELSIINDMQMNYEARRNSEWAELKRLEEQERRIFEEKKLRLKEQEESRILEDEVTQKIAACIFSQNYLSQLVPQVFKKLETEGYFETEDADLQEIEEEFWPWLVNEVDIEIATLEASYELLDSLIEDAVINIKETSVIHPAPQNDYPDQQSSVIHPSPQNVYPDQQSSEALNNIEVDIDKDEEAGEEDNDLS